MPPISVTQPQTNCESRALLSELAAPVSLSHPTPAAVPASTPKPGFSASPIKSSSGSEDRSDEASKIKVRIRYSVAELLSLSKSPLCQPPCPLPILVAKKSNPRGGRQPGQKISPGAQASWNVSMASSSLGKRRSELMSSKLNTGVNNVNTTPAPRRICLYASQLNFQGALKQRTQGLGASKSSAVFQFKGRKTENESETAAPIATNPDASRQQGETANARVQHSQTQEAWRSQTIANGDRSGGVASQIPEWMSQEAPPDPIQPASQQQDFATWREQQKLKDSGYPTPTKDPALSILPITDNSRFQKYFNKAASIQDQLDPLEASFSSLKVQPEVVSKPAPLVEGQNLDFILKALQQDVPIRDTSNPSPIDGVDPAIVPLEDSSVTFSSQPSVQARKLSNTTRVQGCDFTPPYASFRPSGYSPKPPPMNIPPGNIPTAVLKQLSSKNPDVQLGEARTNLASFLESGINREPVRSHPSPQTPASGSIELRLFVLHIWVWGQPFLPAYVTLISRYIAWRSIWGSSPSPSIIIFELRLPQVYHLDRCSC
ncbi:hypothetical protein L0F63_000192 [Massospora cicadina]|nr:hypothetical protein L0F63_000192 [Massospora cicadina]